MPKKIIIIMAISSAFFALYFFTNDVSLVQSQTQFANYATQAPVSNTTNTLAPATPSTQSTITNRTANANDNGSEPSAIERIRAIQARTELQDSLLQDHEDFKRYPEGNAAIADAEHDPVMQRYDIDERTTMNDDNNKGLTIWSDKKFYLNTDVINIYAFVQDDEGNKLRTNFNAQLINDQQRKIATLELSTTGNNIYQTSIKLSDFQSAQLSAGIYKVLINSPEHELTDALTFTLTQPDIELTGEFKEYIDSQGQLIIEAQVLVGASSQYYIQGSLYSSTGVPIGVSQSSTQLNTGLQWLTLNYAGLMIKDAGEAGPYVLKNVSLAKVTIPMMRTPLLQPGFTTESYGLDEFR